MTELEKEEISFWMIMVGESRALWMAHDARQGLWISKFEMSGKATGKVTEKLKWNVSPKNKMAAAYGAIFGYNLPLIVL